MPKRAEQVREFTETYHTIIKAWKTQLMNEFGEGDITPGLARIVMVLQNVDSISSKAIAEHLHMTRGAASQFIDALDSYGYIVRTVDENDRRFAHISLTEKGKARARDLDIVRLKLADKLTAVLTDDELQTLTSLNKKLADSLKNNT